MDPVHFADFVSCEDSLIKPALFPSSSSSLSIHNVACTITGAIILGVVPYWAFKSAPAQRIESKTTMTTTANTFLPSSSSKKNKNSNNNKDGTDKNKGNNITVKNVVTKTTYTTEVWAYLMALTYLFYANFHQHVTGYIMWDLDHGGALHSIFLSWMVYENCKHTLKANLGIPKLSRSITKGITIAATAVELVTPLIFDDTLGKKITTTVGSIAALTVVPFLGYLSWIQRKVDNGKAFAWWVIACIGVKAAEWLVVIEKGMCTTATAAASTTPLWIQRYFHAIVIHAEISLVFVAVFESAFSVIRQNRSSLLDNKKLLMSGKPNRKKNS